MTEQEWLACNDPQAMLDFVTGVTHRIHDSVVVDMSKILATKRKKRLLVCACVLDAKHGAAYASIESGITTIEYAELIADGLREPVNISVYIMHSEIDQVLSICLRCHDYRERPKDVYDQSRCHLIRELFNPYWRRAVAPLGKVENDWALTVYAADADPRWLIWNDGTVPKLAEGIYQEKAWERMPVLADALEEAGCTDEEILNHCRGQARTWKTCDHPLHDYRVWHDKENCPDSGWEWVPSNTSHYRGCWVLDLLTGRS